MEISDRPTDHSRPQYLRQGHVPPDGFQAAPLRHGGGKPSLGRLAPWARPLSKAAVLGARICVLTSPWGDKLQESLSLGEGSHPFPEDLLEDIKEILAPAGQPFFLDILHSVALNIQDPNYQFPRDLEQGVPLTDPPLTSPGIWPLKRAERGGTGVPGTPPPKGQG